MKEFKYLNNIEKEISNCTLCGQCRSVCPTFKVTGLDIYSPRGRVNLVSGLYNKQITYGEKGEEIISTCISCGACDYSCPSGIKCLDIIHNGKAEFFQKNIKFKKSRKVYNKISSNVYLYSIFIGLLSYYKKFIHKDTEEVAKKNLNFNKLLVPKPRKHYFFDYKDKIIADGGHYKRVALFLGCKFKYLIPEIALKAVRLFRKYGIEVVIPDKQLCCGKEIFEGGDFDTSEIIATKNSELFNNLMDISAVITMCSGCKKMLNTTYKEYFNIKFDVPVLNIFDFLSNEEINLEVKDYKDSLCYIKRRSDDSASNFITKNSFGFIIQSLSDVFDSSILGRFIYNDKINQSINNRFIANIEKLDYRTLIVDNPDSYIFLKEKEIELKKEIFHLIEVLQ